MTNITIITGDRNAGKTSLLKEVIRLMPDAIGVVSEKCKGEDLSVLGYDAVLVPTGERLPLCRRSSDESFTKRHGGFWFDMSVFNRVNEYILIHFEGHRPIIIDEIGSLEMKHHLGYYPTLISLIQKPELTLIITMRK